MAQFGYVRLSLTGPSLEDQTNLLSAANCHPIYSDQLGPRARGRVGLHAMLGQVHEGDVIMVVKLDRLSGSVTDLVKVIDLIRRTGGHIVSLTEGFDTRTKEGATIYPLFEVLADVERARVRERTVKGLAAARTNGRFNGRPKLITEDDIAKAFQMHEQGNMTHKDIADALGVSESTWRRTRLKLEREAHPNAERLNQRRPHRHSGPRGDT